VLTRIVDNNYINKAIIISLAGLPCQCSVRSNCQADCPVRYGVVVANGSMRPY